MISTQITQDEKIFLNFKAIRIGLMEHLGYEGKKFLLKNFLRTSDFYLKSEKDIKGRRTVSYSVNKSGTAVDISSYPFNFYENAFVRYGRRYPGRKVFAQKFPAAFQPEIDRLTREFLDRVARRASE